MRVDFTNPLLWALMIGWIMTVVLHEFAHGLVGHWGGDYTIKGRGGLTLNPLQYVNPMMSIALPLVYLALGGVPLPGGATYIRRDLLRSRGWDSAVSAAGPAMNLIIFVLLCIPLHPRAGWVNYQVDPTLWTNAQIFVAGLAFSQIFSVTLNLLPVPPLDGFGIISPFLPPDLRNTLTQPPWGTALFFGLMIAMWYKPEFQQPFIRTCDAALNGLGVDAYYARDAFYMCLRGRGALG